MTTGIIIQAHNNSIRLPQKIFKKINEISVLRRVIFACAMSYVDKIIVATYADEANDSISTEVTTIKGIPFNNVFDFRYLGNPSDVLGRYYACAKEHNLDTIVRITSDCPFVCPDIINLCLKIFKNTNCDLLDFLAVDGLDVQVTNFNSLQKANMESTSNYEKEHVFPYMYSNPDKFKIIHLEDIKLSVDVIDDISRLEKITKD